MPGSDWQRIQPDDPGKTVEAVGDVYLERRSSHKSAQSSGRAEQPAGRPLRTPLYAWPLLVLSVLAPSTSGPVFHTLPDVAPITVAAWRLQATALILLVPGTWQLLQLDQGQRKRLRSQAHLLAASGLSLGIHFASWVWGLYHTSLPHSLLCVTSSPVLLALGCLILRKPISAGELGGSALAGIGAILLAAGSGSNAGVTLIGDLVCLASSCCFLVYMAIGRSVRSWMGLFVYVLPVNLVAAAVLTLASAACDGTRPWRGGLHGTFGWTTDMRYLPSIAWLAAGPGVLGHTSLAALLKWMHPLQVVLPQSINPILGSVEGWLIGVSLLPSGWMTYLGGAIVLAASAFVLVSSHFRTELSSLHKVELCYWGVLLPSCWMKNLGRDISTQHLFALLHFCIEAQARAAEAVEEAKPAAAQLPLQGAIQLRAMHDLEAGAMLHAPRAASQALDLGPDSPLQYDQGGFRDSPAAPLLHDHEAAALITPTQEVRLNLPGSAR